MSGSNSVPATIIFWDVATRKVLGAPLEAEWPGVSSLALSSDGKTLASGSPIRRTIVLWDVATRRRKSQLLGGPATILAFSPDGKTLASGDYDGQISLWDISTGQLLGPPLDGHSKYIVGLGFSKDGKMLVSGGNDKTAVLWNLNSAAWQQQACSLANRNLTEQEWNQYIGGDYRKTCADLP
jgi:WD40 repeat protein